MKKNNVYKNIENFKERFLKDYDIPYNLLNIMEKEENILILQFPNDIGISGMNIKKKDRLLEYDCIYINTNEPLGRRNFSFAHELYHVYYEKGKRKYSIKKDLKNDPIEKNAEKFASNIIIPRLQLLKILKDYNCRFNRNITMERIFDIQMKFNASFQAIVYAIDDLKTDERFKDYRKLMPIIPKKFKAFYTEQYWDELEEKTLQHNKNNLLNSVKSEYIFPRQFEEDLIDNYKNNKIDMEELQVIYEFFEKDIQMTK